MHISTHTMLHLMLTISGMAFADPTDRQPLLHDTRQTSPPVSQSDHTRLQRTSQRRRSSSAPPGQSYQAQILYQRNKLRAHAHHALTVAASRTALSDKQLLIARYNRTDMLGVRRHHSQYRTIVDPHTGTTQRALSPPPHLQEALLCQHRRRARGLEVLRDYQSDVQQIRYKLPYPYPRTLKAHPILCGLCRLCYWLCCCEV